MFTLPFHQCGSLKGNVFSPFVIFLTLHSNPDYNMVAPLATDGSQFPCKGYAKGAAVANLTPGTSVNVDITGGATHSGGHCQVCIFLLHFLALCVEKHCWIMAFFHCAGVCYYCQKKGVVSFHENGVIMGILFVLAVVPCLGWVDFFS